MRIMIVDDEVIIRTGLARVINWEELGLTLLEPAASAEEALSRLPEERPNIVLTDIRMTGQTGLHLAKETKRLFPDTEVIILSGYDDFTYMQQAIRQEVSDYILKTSRPEEIIQTVLRAKARIESKWAAHSQDRFRSTEARNRLLERLFSGSTEGVEWGAISDDLPGLFRERGESSPLQVVLFGAEGWGKTPSSRSLLLFAVENTLKDSLNAETLVEPDRVAAVIRQDGGGNLETVMGRIERLLKARLYAGAGPVVQGPRELSISYAGAVSAFRYPLLLGRRLVEASDIRDRKGGRTVCSHAEELSLSSILLEDDPVALKSWVQQYVEERIADPDMTVESLEASVRSAGLSAHRWLERVMEATGRDATGSMPPSLPGTSGAAPKEELFQSLYTLMKHYHSRLAEGQVSHVQRAMAYIEENLGGDVRLQQVAKHVHLNPSHLSEVFKKETGQTFGDFVTGQKIRRAMEILAVSPAKISEVAGIVGYEDVKYFSQLFKKYTGQTPSEYRESRIPDRNGLGQQRER
ncbi:response regulator [Paenibacillus aurantius]|uniref:Response regulator n=1 Tax=Paenibacillus aurantius TaxID=2918900 RepID=A0AA96LBL9_9BACL|nr:helix-turn-helix domain-containing protein [Paenibacillus aurantius]WNQ10158.1 response regulator [Paenibacillus aurantius]